jgi:hypothetical protein
MLLTIRSSETTPCSGLSQENVACINQAILIFSTFICIVSLSFVLTLVLAIFIATQLFVHKHVHSLGDIHFEGVVDGKQVYRMDFSKWRDSGFKVFKRLDSLIYAHALDYYLVGVFLLCVVTLSVYNGFTLMIVMIFTTMQLIPALKKFSMKEWSNSAITTTMNLCNSIIFFLMFPYTLSAVLRIYLKESFGNNHLDDNLLSYLWLIIANCLLNDLVKSSDYKEIGKILNVRQDIEKKFLALFQTYTENESLIMDRVNLISKMDELNDIEKNYWKNINSWKQLHFDSNYWHHSLDDTLKIKVNELKASNLDRWTAFKSNLAETIYDYCHKRTSNALFEDSIFVMMDVVNKNRTVLQEEILNIEDYFHGDFTKYKEVYDQIYDFYHYLRNKAASPNQIYKQKYDEFVKKKDKVCLNLHPGRRPIYHNHSRKENFFKLVNKESAVLNKAASVLAKAIINGSTGKLETENHETKAIVNAEKMVCDFGEYRFFFHSLSEKLILQSQGYQVIKFSALFQLIMKFMIARIEMLVAILIILTQVYKGALENIVILGIIFFGILIETHLGHAQLWSVIYFIYLVKTTISYQVQSSFSLIDKSTTLFKTMAMITGTPNYIIDSLITLAVFSLIQVLKRRGFSQNFMISFEDVGTAISRVGFYNPAMHQQQGQFVLEIEKHSRD